ncbi:MAG TPA: NADH-ubiquinone oxidoreductase-F iron-sulfur binding region domain-containing protein [Armatimonadota bacterium]|nr:NADH-ubiquinone oxidoreductase-F iron-sulfur binding region domain-containing protein [Armatimonadota bacterium]
MPFYRAHVLVCNGTPCILKGSRAVQTALVDEIKKKGLENEIKVVETGCLGISEVGPVMVVYPEGITYCGVTVNDVPTIVEEHLLKGRVVERLVYKERTASHVSAAAASRSREQRVVLKNVGSIDPTSIEEYIAVGGYEAMGKALTQMTPLEVIKAVKDSGLRGRGGAAFPTGLKWELTADAPGENKTIVCNADEGEPGNFKDRLILEGDPHSIVEAMIIAGYAIGANKGYVYIRGEYHQSVSHLERAIAVAREMELLGEDILGSGFNFDIEVFKGAGAYICGEETALLESLEGTRGESRMKPPYPPTSGLHGQPTVINNVETLANIPQIIANGAEWFASIGTEKSKGTKIFSPCGDVLYPGVYEVPFGTTMREVIYEMAGGIKSGKDLKAVLIGGPSGICISKEDLDRQFAFEDLPPGAGALIVIDEDKCIVDIMQNCAKFFLHESCGQCVPCREGTKRLYELFTWWQGGAGSPGDLALAQSLGDVMSVSAKCGLGQFAATAFRTSLPLFEEEYRAHVVDRVCPSGVCKMNNGCESEVV